MKKLIIILLCMTATSASFAKHKDGTRPIIEIEKVEAQEVGTPVHRGDNNGDTLQIPGISLNQSRREKWLQVSVEYETRPEWMDRLTLEFYVLMPNPEKEDALFKGVVSYVDIPKGREHAAVMYMHFNSYARNYGRGKIRTAVLAKIDGKVVAVDEDSSLDDPWWENTDVNRCGLLNRLDTPFRVVNEERFESQDPCVWK